MVLRSLVILHAVMDVGLEQLVPVGQRAARDINMLLGVRVDSKHERLPRISEPSANL